MSERKRKMFSRQRMPVMPLVAMLCLSTTRNKGTVVSGWMPSATSPRRIHRSTVTDNARSLILYSSSDPNSGDDNQESVSLFEDYSDDSSSTLPKATTNTSESSAAQFGESVPLKSKASFGDSVPLNSKASFGESVPLKRPTESSSSSSSDLLSGESSQSVSTTTTSQTITTTNTNSELQAMKERNILVAVASVLIAIGGYLWQYTHPITPVQLLATMQSQSAPLTTIGTNGRPTVVDFWAPWCENCKLAAPTLQKLEEDYSGKVNFVMVNGDLPQAWPLIERFGVDAIPHIALISAEGDVETALIGPIPKRVLEADLNALIENADSSINNKEGQPKRELPYKMLDAFVNQPELRRVQFTEEMAKKVGQ